MVYYGVYLKNKLCSIKVFWNSDVEDHFCPLIFQDKKEAERFAETEYKVKRVKIMRY
jgi:hypothetical protein